MTKQQVWVLAALAVLWWLASRKPASTIVAQYLQDIERTTTLDAEEVIYARLAVAFREGRVTKEEYDIIFAAHAAKWNWLKSQGVTA